MGLSVSRIGGAAQVPVMKEVAGNLKLGLAQFREVEAFASFASDLDPTTLHTLARGNILIELLKQNRFSPLSVQQQIVLIFAALNGFLDDVPLEELKNVKRNLVALSAPGSKDISIDSTKKISADQLRTFLNKNINTGSF